tara:strand:- start:30 stop:227 length:198 start_codon:yes stop_codon:yes gene_type:complete
MKRAITLTAAFLTLFLASCQFNNSSDEPIAAGASAVVGPRNVIGAEVNLLGWRRIGIGLWLKEPN